MKKFFVMAVVAMICATGFSKTIDEVFNAFPKADNVKLIDVPELRDIIATKVNSNDEGKELAEKTKNIEAVTILTIENANVAQKEIARKLMAGGIEGMEELLNVEEKGEEVTIFAAKHDEKIHQMLIFALEKDEVGIILIKGDLDLNDIQKVGLFN